MELGIRPPPGTEVGPTIWFLSMLMPETVRKTYGRFAMQFPPSGLFTLAERYGYGQDDDALNAGKNIANGDYSVANLKIIVEWKSARIAGLIEEKNSATDVAKSLRFATNKGTSESRQWIPSVD